MEKIDLNNYEAYFLDYMEGSLGDEKKQDLFVFLELYPQLKSEFELDFGAAALFPEAIIFENKAALKIDESNLIITPNTLADLIVASVEKQLSPTHQTQLSTYIAQHEVEALYASYKNATLTADLSIVYQEKEQLKQKGGLVIAMPFFKRFAAIAAVGLVLVTLAVNWNSLPGTILADAHSKFVNNQTKTKILERFRKMNEMEGESLIPSNTQNDTVLPSAVTPKEMNERIKDETQDMLVEIPKEEIIVPLESVRIKSIPIQLLPFPNQDDFVKKEDTEPHLTIPELNATHEIYATIRHEEPYKIVTDAASNLVNKEVKFTRDRDMVTSNYVAYSFKLGSFGFEHKKASK